LFRIFDFSGKKSIYVSIIKVKKALSIVLVVVFLFNVIGYYGIYVAMLSQARTALNEKIDNDQYKEDQTITIKLPLTLPYPGQQNEYQRVEGDFEHQGEFYKLVKQKYLNDTLYVVCLKNVDEKKAVKMFSDLAKLSTDQSSAPSNNQNAKTVVNIIKDYNPVVEQIQLAPRQVIELGISFTFFSTNILSQDITVFSPPPESTC
jgi:hypothetical protein